MVKPVTGTILSLSDLNTTVDPAEPRISSHRLAQVLGFADERDIKALYERNRAEIDAWGVCPQTEDKPLPGSKGGRPRKIIWFNEPQALNMAVISGAPNAPVIRRALIEVFMAHRRGQVPAARPGRPEPIHLDRVAEIGLAKAVERRAEELAREDFLRYQMELTKAAKAELRAGRMPEVERMVVGFNERGEVSCALPGRAVAVATPRLPVRGEAVLSSADVEILRLRHANGESVAALAREAGVTRQALWARLNKAGLLPAPRTPRDLPMLIREGLGAIRLGGELVIYDGADWDVEPGKDALVLGRTCGLSVQRVAGERIPGDWARNGQVPWCSGRYPGVSHETATAGVIGRVLAIRRIKRGAS